MLINLLFLNYTIIFTTAIPHFSDITPKLHFFKVKEYIKTADLCLVFPQQFTNAIPKGQIISECPLEILDFPKIPQKI